MPGGPEAPGKVRARSARGDTDTELTQGRATGELSIDVPAAPPAAMELAQSGASSQVLSMPASSHQQL
jgi:hypothetical protein